MGGNGDDGNLQIPMKPAVSISIVIPTRNRAGSLNRTLRSIGLQSILPDEVIIVDSSDEPLTQTHLNESVLPVVIMHGPPSVCRQRNMGIARCVSPYILLLDDDIELSPNYLESVSALLARPEVGIATGLIYEKREGNWEYASAKPSVMGILHAYCFGLSAWFDASKAHYGNPLANAVLRKFRSRPNRLTRAGWPIVVHYGEPEFTAPVYGLGAAMFRHSDLKQTAFETAFGPNGIGDNYDLAMALGKSITVTHRAHARHHKEPSNRVGRATAYYLRTAALHHIMLKYPRFDWRNRTGLLWSILGNLLFFVCRREWGKVGKSFRLLTEVTFGRNPYRKASEKEFLLSVYWLIPENRRRKLPAFAFRALLITLLDLLSVAYVMPLILAMVNPAQLGLLAHRYLGLTLDNRMLISLLFFTLGTFILKNVFQARWTAKQVRFIHGISSDLSSRMMRAHLQNPYITASAADKNELLRDIFHLPMAFASSILMPLHTLFCETAILIILFAIVVAWQPAAAVASLALMGLMMGLLVTIRRRKTSEFNRTIIVLYRETVQAIMNIFHGLPEIKSAGREADFHSRFSQASDSHYRQLARLSAFKQANSRYLEIVFIVLVSAAVLLLVLRGGNAGTWLLFSFFAGASIKIIPSFSKLMSAYTDLMANRNAVKILSERRHDPIDNKDWVRSFSRDIRAENIDFAYGDRSTLRNMGFHVCKGEFIAVSGPSGAGKSTLLQLLSGLLSPAGGKLIIDGSALGTNQSIGFSAYVSQQPFLFHGTLRENITMGAETGGNVEEILDRLGLLPWAMSLPERIDTNLILESKALSGGQKQRIALARALYQSPELLILDEATNQLDSELEEQIFHYLDSLRETQGITIIAVSHGSNAAKFATRSWAIEQGSVLEYA